MKRIKKFSQLSKNESLNEGLAEELLQKMGYKNVEELKKQKTVIAKLESLVKELNKDENISEEGESTDDILGDMGLGGDEEKKEEPKEPKKEEPKMSDEEVDKEIKDLGDDEDDEDDDEDDDEENSERDKGKKILSFGEFVSSMSSKPENKEEETEEETEDVEVKTEESITESKRLYNLLEKYSENEDLKEGFALGVLVSWLAGAGLGAILGTISGKRLAKKTDELLSLTDQIIDRISIDTGLDKDKISKLINAKEIEDLVFDKKIKTAEDLEKHLKDKAKNIKEGYESVNEAKITSDEEFEEYATTVLKKAFGSDFDEAKAKETIDGLKSKYKEDYGAMVGALTSGLG